MTYNEFLMAIIHEAPNTVDAHRLVWIAVCGEGYETQDNLELLNEEEQ